MPTHHNITLVKDWSEEIISSLIDDKCTCLAIFSSDKKLVFANPAMHSLFNDEPSKTILNPDIDNLWEYKKEEKLVYRGFLTVGNEYSVNTSILAQVFRNNDYLFIIGGVYAQQLVEQNKTMHQLNSDINNLQRQLIKEKKTLEKTLNQLNEANNQLKELNATKDKLYSIIAHDLKAPFNNILGFSDLLITNAGDYDAAQNNNFLKIIHSETLATLRLLENLLNWSRSQTGQLSFDPEKIILSEIIMEIYAYLNPSAIAKNISLKYHTKNLEVKADRNMLNTILRNLISNSIKFTHPEGEISISEISVNSFIEITVQDNGVGMSKQIQNKLFGMDNNITTKGTNDEKGTGLGLVLCKEFTEMHGGNIRVESEPGEGSKFTFAIPAWDDGFQSVD